MRKKPLDIINRVVGKKYNDAKTIFWAGSIAREEGNDRSDLDLVVVYNNISNAYREAFIYEEWPIDVFVHDAETLQYFIEESRTGSGISGTISMILNGQEITSSTDFSKNIKKVAQEVFDIGPLPWDDNRIEKERFLITDILEDIKYPMSRSEQIASASKLYEMLAQFYFRSQNKWCASGKSIIRYLEREDTKTALEFSESFEVIFQTGESAGLAELTKKILKPFGGLLWDGFKSDAPKEYRLNKY